MKSDEREINQDTENYEIRIKGHLEDRWEDWFEGLKMRREEDGTTVLSGSLPDQTALHSVLLKIRNMNLKVIYVRQIETHDWETQNERRK